MAYWLPKKSIDILENNKSLDDISKTRAGMITGNNKKFVRMWFEVPDEKIQVPVIKIWEDNQSELRQRPRCGRRRHRND